MSRVIRDVLAVVVVAGVLILVAGLVGRPLGNLTDKMPPYVGMLVWIAWEGLLLGVGIAAIWLWRHRRPSS
jgi:hypothetical protein